MTAHQTDLDRHPAAEVVTHYPYVDNIHLSKHMLKHLNRWRYRYQPFIEAMIDIAPRLFASVALTAPDDSPEPRWDQGFFMWMDALALCAALRLRNPSRYVEVGSGNSTRFARWCISTYGLRTKIISIDPSPRLVVKEIADEVFAVPLQDAPIQIFEQLRDGDIAFYDGSHVMCMKTDMMCFCYEIIPALDRGVMIGFHDTYLPLLTQMAEDHFAAALLLGGDRFAPDLPAHFLSCIDEISRRRLLPLLDSPNSAGAKRIMETHYAVHRSNISGEVNGGVFLFSRNDAFV